MHSKYNFNILLLCCAFVFSIFYVMINAAFAVPMMSIPQAEQLRFITGIIR